ncbi:MAG: hypothetical protein E6J20_03055 [Chloroflexi bacterium]|nr:MAG: hypothetical protein E6J20_03055 [Chloroflexota bacterium]
MTAIHANQLVDGYLGRLELELLDVPEDKRREIIEEIRDHIADERRSLSSESDADLLNLLDRLGDPAEIAAAARGGKAEAPPAQSRVGVVEILALILTPVIWPVGVVLLWASAAWTTRQKLLGTLVPVGGYPAILFVVGVVPLMFGTSSYCSFGTDSSGQVYNDCQPPPLQIVAGIVYLAITVALLALPVVVGIYLATRLRSRPTSA